MSYRESDHVAFTPLANSKSRQEYLRCIDRVAFKASNDAFLLNTLRAAMPVPGDKWSRLMYQRLRVRWELIMARFDREFKRESSFYDVPATGSSLSALVHAISSMTKPRYWNSMEDATKELYFCLLLDLIEGAVCRDETRRSPGTVQQRQEVSLHYRMILMPENPPAVSLLMRIFNQGFDRLGEQRAVSIDRILNYGNVAGKPRLQDFCARLDALRKGKSCLDFW